MKIALKKEKIFIAGHNGMVGSSILRYFKKLGLKNIIVRSKKKLDLTNVVDKANKKLSNARLSLIDHNEKLNNLTIDVHSKKSKLTFLNEFPEKSDPTKFDS